MYKKFLSAILFGALTIASTSTFVSCKDYDDDISNLQTQVNSLTDLVSKKETTINTTIASLQSQLTTLETAYKDGDKEQAATIALLQKAVDDLKDAVGKNLDDLVARDGSLSAAIIKAQTAADQALTLLTGQDGKLTTVANELETVSNNLANLTANYNTLSAGVTDLTTRVAELEGALAAQQADFQSLLRSIAEGEPINIPGYDDTTIKQDLEKAQNAIAALQGTVATLSTQLDNALNTEIESVKGRVSVVEANLSDLQIAHNNSAAELNDLKDQVEANRVKAEQLAGEDANLRVLISLLSKDLRSLVYMPKLYVDGIETIEYPYLRYALLDKQSVQPLKRGEVDILPTNPDGIEIRDWEDFLDLTLNDSVFFAPAWPIEYHMNPANASTEYADVNGFYAYNAEVMTRAFYDTKQNNAATWGIMQADRWDNQYNTSDMIWNKRKGIMTVGLRVKNVASSNPSQASDDPSATYFPSDETEDGNAPYSVKNIILALQAAGGDTIITSDYAQLLPEKIKIEGMIWNTHPTYWNDKNKRIKDFWENKKGYGTSVIWPADGAPYNYRIGDGTPTNGRDEEGNVCGRWVHVWDTPQEALFHPADIELYIDQEINLSQYLGVHWYYAQDAPLTDNVKSHRSTQTWKFDAIELQRMGFVWVFDTVDYYVDKNKTHDSRYLRYTDHKLGKIVSADVTELGATYEDQTHTSVGREPLVRVRLYHFSNISDMNKWNNLNTSSNPKADIDAFNALGAKPVLDGYIRVHITKPEKLEIEYPEEKATFDLCNGIRTNKDRIGGWNWSMFNARVLQDKLNGMEKEQFDANYRIELDETIYAIPPADNGHTVEVAQFIQAGTPNADNPDGHYYYANVSAPTPRKSNPLNKNTDKIGVITTTIDDVGTTNHAFTWYIPEDELEALTHHAQGDRGETPVTIERWVHYTGHFYSSDHPNNAGAMYDDIYIKLTITITRDNVALSVTSSKDEQYWYKENGSWRRNLTPNFRMPWPADDAVITWSAYDNGATMTASENQLYRSIANNTPYPEDGGRTVPWRNNILYNWDQNKVTVTNANASKFYFAPFEYQIKALDGAVYMVTPKRGKNDDIFNKLICKYWNEKHVYQLDQNNPFNSAKLEENNATLNACAIRYQPLYNDVIATYPGVANTYPNAASYSGHESEFPRLDGVWSNDTLYAYVVSGDSRHANANSLEYEPIAVINNTATTNYLSGGGQVTLFHEYQVNKWLDSNTNNYSDGHVGAENEIAEALVNAVGYLTKAERDATTGLLTGEFADKGNPLIKQLRSYVGVIATQKCNIANQMKDYKIDNFAVFQMPWERPINILQENDFMVDAINNSDYIYMVDLLKLFDWRGVNDGHMWGSAPIPSYWTNQTWRDNQWLWAYYNVKAIKIDLRTNVVKTNLSQTNPSTIVPLSSVSGTVRLTARGNTGLEVFNFDLRSPVNFNDHSQNNALIQYMGLTNPRMEGLDSDKAKFGYIRYENNGQNVDDFDVWVPISVVYDWGEILDQPIKIHIHYTRGN